MCSALGPHRAAASAAAATGHLNLVQPSMASPVRGNVQYCTAGTLPTSVRSHRWNASSRGSEVQHGRVREEASSPLVP